MQSAEYLGVRNANGMSDVQEIYFLCLNTEICRTFQHNTVSVKHLIKMLLLLCFLYFWQSLTIDPIRFRHSFRRSHDQTWITTIISYLKKTFNTPKLRFHSVNHCKEIQMLIRVM